MINKKKKGKKKRITITVINRGGGGRGELQKEEKGKQISQQPDDWRWASGRRINARRGREACS